MFFLGEVALGFLSTKSKCLQRYINIFNYCTKNNFCAIIGFCDSGLVDLKQ